MLFLLSPAKALDYKTPLPQALSELPHTSALFTDQSAELIAILRSKTPVEIAQLMDLSDDLAALNVARYQAWSPEFTAENARQAILAFNGDVYEGFNARTLSVEALNWAQNHICILSGLYGVLRPLDWMQPYRLEMGTKLANAKGANLYQFWSTTLASYLKSRLTNDDQPVLVNLASQEYFKSVDVKTLGLRVITCMFEDYKAGQFKIISFHAKRARGLMARFAAQHQIKQPDQLKSFDLDDYQYCAAASTENQWVFRRGGA